MMNMTIQGLNVHYIEQGAGDRTVLFLHGWGASVELYQPVFDLLAGRGYRVLAFDMPGVGGTDLPSKPLSMQDYIDFTLAFCRHMQLEEAILMAHSHGGRIALSLMSDPACPLRCKKAVLMGSTGVVLPRSTQVKVKLALYKTAKFLGTNPITKPLFGDLYEEMRDKRSSADYKAAVPVMRQTMNNVLRVDLQEKMPKIQAEVLLVYGDRDTATPVLYGRIMEQKIPGSGLAVIQNAGHFAFADNWPQFKAVMEAFL